MKSEAETMGSPPESTDTGSSSPSTPLDLIKPPTYDWVDSTVEERIGYLDQIEAIYLSILDEFFEESNSCVNKFKGSNRSHMRWRRSLILATGGLAIVNLLAAYTSRDGGTAFLKDSLPLFAAVYAAVLAILTNLESFSNFLGKAQAYRDSRELFLDAYREFELLWQVKVRPLYPRPEACVNAAEVYRTLVQRDRALRGKLKELTATKKASDTSARSAND